MTGNTFVLVHGAWHGGWCWPQRRHLLSGAITLETFVQDLVEHLDAEEVD